MKKVSVIINCYNGEKYLKQTIESILNQEYQNWEIIFWDNQSTDKSKNIFQSYNDKRLRYFYAKKHTTLYKARNLACEQAVGDYLAFIDCDDWWEIDFLESRKIFFEEAKFDFFYSNCLHFFQNSNKFEKFTFINLESGKIFNFLSKNYLVKISCFIIKRSIFLKEKKFNNNYNTIGDFEYVMRIAHKYLGHATQKPLANIRFHEKNFLDNNRKMFFKEYLDWYKNLDFKDLDYAKNRYLFIYKLYRLRIISIFPKFFINIFKKK